MLVMHESKVWPTHQKLSTSSDALANWSSHLGGILIKLEQRCFRGMVGNDGVKTPTLFRCGGRHQEPHLGSKGKVAHVAALSQPPDPGS
jgi:hypothetical protein